MTKSALAPIRRLRQGFGVLVLGGLVLAATGCTPTAAVAPVVSPSASKPADTVVATPAATEIAPLRGTTVAAGALANPALSAKIDNQEDARPQIGLESADIVFEELVEGGLTRYVAVWQSDLPDLIGPVRSIRPMDPDIVSPFGGIIAYSGGQQMFVDMMEKAPVYNAIHGASDTDSTFYRTDDKEAPHNVVVKAKELVSQHAKLAAPGEQFAYSSDEASSTAAQAGTPTASVQDVYSNARYPTWTYDADQLVWLRANESGKDLDSKGAQLSATNVISMIVDIDWRYDYIPKTVMVGSGKAYVSTGGKTVTVTWRKDSAAAPIRLVDEHGVTVNLAPGNTWIQLVPSDTGSVKIVAPTTK